jgi:hypothetical protein
MGGTDSAPEGIFDPEGESSEQPGDLDESDRGHRGQAPMEVDSSRYYKTGHVGVGIGKDGMPMIGGEGPPEPDVGLTDNNFICAESEDRSRPECVHLVTLVLPADGVAKGFGELRQIRQFCRWLATGSEQWEHRGNVYACNARTVAPKLPDPQDGGVSMKVIRDFRTKQKQLASDTAEKSGKLDF